MAHRISLLFLLLVPLFLSSALFGYNTSEVKSWCSKTPFPRPCEYFLISDNNNPPQSAIKGGPDFLKIAVQLALRRAALAHTDAFALQSRYRNKREKAVWADCLELYELAVLRLNQTADPVTKRTKEDAQTWLSAALTNLDTCRVGFDELGVTDTVFAMISNNASKLIGNALEVNNGPYNQLPTYNDDFPSWVKPGDRKLLRTSFSAVSGADVVVAKDGSGKYKAIKEALAAAERRSGSGRYVIYVKKGVYDENVQIGNKLKNIMLVGEGIGKTIITGSRSVGGGYTTYGSATVAVVGDGFIARDITFRNTAGAIKGQAVALRSGSDLSVFYRCSFEGYQDTLYLHSNRQYYRECDVYGTVDFMFGNAACILQNCNIYPRKTPTKTNTLTAQGRSDPNQNTGIVIHNCRVTAAEDLKPVEGSVRTFLGRPWRKYSRTVFMKTYMDGVIHQAGWMPWSGNFALETLYFAEYKNTGPGSSTKDRVNWHGYHVLDSAAEASKFTVGKFLSGNSWLPATKVPFTSGL